MLVNGTSSRHLALVGRCVCSIPPRCGMEGSVEQRTQRGGEQGGGEQGWERQGGGGWGVV